MENIKRTLVEYPYLEKPVEIYERECGHKIVFAYKASSLINISSWVKTGSINENDENNGISHFLEHLMFKGTSNNEEWHLNISKGYSIAVDEIDKRLHLPAEEYIYGLDIYYLYRLQCRLKQYQEKITVGKYLNFIEFIKLRCVIIDLFRKKEADA